MLDIERARKALEETAKRNGVSYEVVIKDIEDSIAEAIANCAKGNGGADSNIWMDIPCAGDIPTPLELVAYLSGALLVQDGQAPNNH